MRVVISPVTVFQMQISPLLEEEARGRGTSGEGKDRVEEDKEDDEEEEGGEYEEDDGCVGGAGAHDRA